MLLACPECNYDLRGLPRNHTCPECGFEYDETLLVFHARNLAGAAMSTAIIVLVAAGAALLGARTIGRWRAHMDIVESLAILVGAWAALRLVGVGLSRGWRYAIVDAEYLRIARGNAREQIPWSHIGRVTAWPTMTVSLRDDVRKHTIRVRGVFASWEQARTFAARARIRARMSRRHNA